MSTHYDSRQSIDEPLPPQPPPPAHISFSGAITIANPPMFSNRRSSLLAPPRPSSHSSLSAQILLGLLIICFIGCAISIGIVASKQFDAAQVLLAVIPFVAVVFLFGIVYVMLRERKRRMAERAEWERRVENLLNSSEPKWQPPPPLYEEAV